MDIDINAAEQVIRDILPSVKALDKNVINTKGTFLIFNNLLPQNQFLDEVHYEFKLFVAINSLIKNQTLAYEPLSSALDALMQDWQQNQRVRIGRIKPNAIQKLIVYEVTLTYEPCITPKNFDD